MFIAPYDDPYTIAGQGTIGNEILRQCNMDALDAIFVAVGGGGLVAGIAAYVKALKPHVKIIGVEPIGAFWAGQEVIECCACAGGHLGERSCVRCWCGYGHLLSGALFWIACTVLAGFAKDGG